MTKVSEVMKRDVVKVQPTTRFESLLCSLSRDGASRLVYVVEETPGKGGKLVGIISTFDVLKVMISRRGIKDLFSGPKAVDLEHAVDMNCDKTAADLMIEDFQYVSDDDDCARVVELIIQNRIQAVPVLDSRMRLAGEVTRQALIRKAAALNWCQLVERSSRVRQDL